MSDFDLKTVKVMIFIVMGFTFLLGLMPYGYSFSKKRLYASKICFLYAITVNAVFTIFYVSSIFNDYLTNTLDLKNAVKLYSYMNILASIVCLNFDLVRVKQSLRFLNRIRLFETIKFFGKLDKKMVKEALVITSLKSLAFPAIIEFTLLLRQHDAGITTSLFNTFYMLLPYVVSNMIPNCIFSILTICKYLIVLLNQHLMEIVQEANCLQTPLQMQLQKPFYRMQRFCELSDKLDVLCAKYFLIYEQKYEYISLVDVPFICFLLCNVLGITSGLFTQYNAIVESFINDEPFDIFDAATNAIFLLISICEIILLANVCNDNLVMVERTGTILQNINLMHADVRFKQAVDTFTLLVHNTKCQVKPLGLLEVNISLLHAVLSTVTSFLLILIQSDLTQRFSLK